MSGEEVVAVRSGRWVVVDCALYNGHHTIDVPVLINLEAIESAHPYVQSIGDADLTQTVIRLRSGETYRARVPLPSVTDWLGL